MKSLLSLFFTGLIFFSCDEIDNPDINELPQEWTLIGYKSVWITQEEITPIKDSIYHYRLEKDGSFVKTIGTYKLTGTYDFETFEGKNYVNLNFDEASVQVDVERSRGSLIHYCGQPYEVFTILDSKTVVGSWGQCDGPNLYFRRR